MTGREDIADEVWGCGRGGRVWVPGCQGRVAGTDTVQLEYNKTYRSGGIKRV